MARKNEAKQDELDFFKLTIEVQNLDKIAEKDSESYKKQHVKCVKMIKELNGIFGKGYVNLKQTRQVIGNNKAAK